MKSYLSSKTLLMIAILFLLAMFNASSRVALAARPSEEKVTQALVTWTLKPENCPDINVEINGKGKRYQVINVEVLPNGSTRLIINDFVQGTATDTNGGKYTFIYANQDRHRIPPSGSPILVNMTDSFILEGPGTENDLSVGFVWRWTYTPPAPEFPPVDNWKQIHTIGDINCDPI
jgi:hypothetical protein